MSTPADEPEGVERTPDPNNPAQARLSAPITGARWFDTDEQRDAWAAKVDRENAAAAAEPINAHDMDLED